MSSSTFISLLRDCPIVVTGMGCISAAGNSVDVLWETAVRGQGTASWRELKIESGHKKFAICSGPELDVSRPELHPVRKADRCVQMAWLAANQAWQQSRLTGAYPPDRIGIMVGSSRGPLEKISDSFCGTGRLHPLPSLAASSTFASLGGALAQCLKIEGPGATVSATCASAAFAIGLAAEQILLGKADAMLVGGTDAPLQPTVMTQLQAAGVLGSHEDARRTCRPFDVTRDGIVLGEGSAFLVLESAHNAANRRIETLGRLAGWCMKFCSSGRTEVPEDGSGLVQVMQQALQLAELNPVQIGHINAHGSGTVSNDVAEARAIVKLFGNRVASLPCTSTKPVTGHCLGATPALEAILAIQTLRHQIVPPTANFQQLDPSCAINVQSQSAQPVRLESVMSNSLGFWGYHASLVFSNHFP